MVFPASCHHAPGCHCPQGLLSPKASRGYGWVACRVWGRRRSGAGWDPAFLGPAGDLSQRAALLGSVPSWQCPPLTPPLPGRNYTLKSMPLPMSDVAQAYRSNPERTEEAVHKVGQRAGVGSRAWIWLLVTTCTPQLQSCLARNQTRRALPTQTFRLQQGILTSSSEQVSIAQSIILHH